MEKTEDIPKSDNPTAERTWTADHALQAWEHFANAGGVDKNTMITVVSWLLGFSGTIIGYIVTKLLDPKSFVLVKPVPTLFLGGVGIVTSIAAGVVALLYGGYATKNWGWADTIAEGRGWHDLLPDGANADRHRNPVGLAAWLVRRKNCATLPLIFKIFIFFATVSAVIHLAFLSWSIILIRM
jgi:hypothetical protein